MGALVVPEGVRDPLGIWFFDVVVPIAGIAVAIWLLIKSVRAGRATNLLLFFVASASCFWLETFGDWGAYLVYSPKFRHYTLPIRQTTPIDPWFMPAAYALFFMLYSVGVRRAATRLSKEHTRESRVAREGAGPGAMLSAQAREVSASRVRLSLAQAILLLGVPLLIAWDLLVEGVASALGWWNYTTLPVGPHLPLGRGSMPLLWPLFLVAWPNVVTIWASRGEGQLTWFERRMGVAHVRQGWRRELARLGAWILVFNITYMVLVDGPPIVYRLLFGHASVYVP